MTEDLIRIVAVTKGAMMPGVWITLAADGYDPHEVFVPILKPTDMMAVYDEGRTAYRRFQQAQDIALQLTTYSLEGVQ